MHMSRNVYTSASFLTAHGLGQWIPVQPTQSCLCLEIFKTQQLHCGLHCKTHMISLITQHIMQFPLVSFCLDFMISNKATMLIWDYPVKSVCSPVQGLAAPRWLLFWMDLAILRFHLRTVVCLGLSWRTNIFPHSFKSQIPSCTTCVYLSPSPSRRYKVNIGLYFPVINDRNWECHMFLHIMLNEKNNEHQWKSSIFYIILQ